MKEIKLKIKRVLTKKDEAHYIIFKALYKYSTDTAYEEATKVIDFLKERNII